MSRLKPPDKDEFIEIDYCTHGYGFTENRTPLEDIIDDLLEEKEKMRKEIEELKRVAKKVETFFGKKA